MQEVVTGTLEAINLDDAAGTLLRATGMRLRLHCPDLQVAVNIAASEDPDRYLEWSFSTKAPWKPKLDLRMDSEVANGFLQGAESLPVAMARGQIKCSGDARAALLYVPAAKLIQERYGKLVHKRYPHLAVDR